MNVNAIDSFGQTSLHWAASNRDFDKAKNLVERMSVDNICLQSFENKYTALHLAAQNAAQNGASELSILLLEKGGRELACKVDKFGQTALHWCAYSQDSFASANALVQVMEPEDLAIETNDNRYTVLHLAAQGNNDPLINALVKKGGRELACKVDKYGQTALHWCAYSQDSFASGNALVQVMELEDLAIQTSDNRYTVLHLAAQGNNNPLINALVEKGGRELACKVDKYGQTALHWAATKGDFEACQMLFGHMDSTSINSKSQSGQTARDFAIANNYSEIISLLS